MTFIFKRILYFGFFALLCLPLSSLIFHKIVEGKEPENKHTFFLFFFVARVRSETVCSLDLNWRS